MTLLFWNLLYPSVTCDYVTIIYNVMLTPNSRFKNKKEKQK